METRHVDVQITNPDGSIVFQRKDVEVPLGWSDRAATILAQKYLNYNENSALTVVGRIARQIMLWGIEQRYFDNEEEANKFMSDLERIMLEQKAAFNSPVWFNVGVKENSNQVAACFIYGVEDNMNDILAHVQREGMTFKSGSGAGVNVSKLRAKGELLSNRGVASGPISFMRIWDQTAGSIKSGGKTRRSAKMVIMNVDHPDIEDFITCKLEEEKKAKALIDAGFSAEEAYSTVAFQNANHSIMVSDDFMRAVDEDRMWNLKNRGDGKVNRWVKARGLFRKIAEVAWATGDPGIQFYDRINTHNPVPSLGTIECSNPCAEHVAINNSACNLSSINLIKYMMKNKELNYSQFANDIATIITAQDIMIDVADYPTPETKHIAKTTRPLGLGFTNLGAYLMLRGIPYDSDKAREVAESITKKMTWYAYNTSIELAKKLGSFAALENNTMQCATIASQLTEDPELAREIDEGFLRNSQLTLLAPTGTISFLMDCDTTGIEPLFARSIIKKLAGGGTLEMKAKCVENAPNEACIQTADEVTPHNHILMMAACQKHLNGAISKTVNMPAEATVEDVMDIYMQAWKQDLKSIAIYRDGCKKMQPLTSAPKYIEEEDIEEDTEEDAPELVTEDQNKWVAIRRKLPDTRQSITHKFDVQGLEGYITVGFYGEGDIGEIFIRTQKQGTTIQGLLDGFATAVSLALQYGVPPTTFVEKFVGSKFEPAGITTNEEIRFATSILDYVFRWIKKEFLDEDEDEPYIIETPMAETHVVKAKISFDGPPCPTCQTITGRSGSCYLCPTCGTTTGCS